MLPYFKIIEDKQTNTATDFERQRQSSHQMQGSHQPPSKPRRSKKAASVPVHQHYTRSSSTHHHQEPAASVPTQSNRKNFSANFNGVVPQEIADEPDVEKRVSRRFLFKELEHVRQENQSLQNSCEQFARKNAKLKEKLTQLLDYNQEMLAENTALRNQYEDLQVQYDDCKNLLAEPKVCQACIETDQNIDAMKKEYVHLRKSHQECQEDCSMLKNVVYRLNVQLERYQEKLRVHNFSIKDQTKIAKEYDEPNAAGADVMADNGDAQHLGHDHTPVQWGRVNTHTLAPLLNAYQEIIGEKEEIIANYEAEMAQFTGRLKEVLKENEGLHYKLNDDSECSKVLRVQLEAAKGECRAVKEQNDLLIKKCALKQDKIEEILKCYEQKIESLKRDYAVLHETYCKARTEVAGLKEKNKALVDAQDDFRNERSQFIPLAVHTSSVNECKKWYEELKLQYESERNKLETTMEELRSQLKEINTKLVEANSDKLQLEVKLKSAEKQIKKLEAKHLDVEHNLHEVQLSRTACRKQLHKAMSFAKDLVNEQETLLKALNQRQIENKAVKRIGTDIASRMDLLRNQLKTVQKEAWQELSTVEERIQEQDSLIISMKEEHEQEIERLKNIIKEKG